jgi:hypothetical protein
MVVAAAAAAVAEPNCTEGDYLEASRDSQLQYTDVAAKGLSIVAVGVLPGHRPNYSNPINLYPPTLIQALSVLWLFAFHWPAGWKRDSSRLLKEKRR